jgi:hypothetical protein
MMLAAFFPRTHLFLNLLLDPSFLHGLKALHGKNCSEGYRKLVNSSLLQTRNWICVFVIFLDSSDDHTRKLWRDRN